MVAPRNRTMEVWCLVAAVLAGGCTAASTGARQISIARTAYDGVPTTDAMLALTDVDFTFDRNWMRLSAEIAERQFPVMYIDGNKITLYTRDGKVRRSGGTIIPPYNELKDISHIGPALFTIGYRSWQNPGDSSWKGQMEEFRKQVQKALANVDQVDWSNPAWSAADAEKLKVFMRDSLKLIDAAMAEIQAKGTYTREDYADLAKRYMHTMDATMFLTNISGTIKTIKTLQAWRDEIGQEEWDKLYVVQFGEFGRPGASGTIETNPKAYQVASTIKPENRTRYFILPTVKTEEEARRYLGSMILSKDLAEATFTTRRSLIFPFTKGLQVGLTDPTTNLSMENNKYITDEFIKTGTVKLPYLGLLDGAR